MVSFQDGRWGNARLVLGVALIVGLVCSIRLIWLLDGGVCLSAPTMLFHFGHRFRDGATLSLDFVYPSGPLPLHVEAGVQSLLGTSYRASIFAGALVAAARVVVVWFVARRLAGRFAAGLLVVCCACSPAFGPRHHVVDAYVELLLLLAGTLLAMGSAARPRRGSLVAAGCATALTALADPGAALVATVLLGAAAAVLTLRSQGLPSRGLALLGLGIMGGIGLAAGFISLSGDLGRALKQTLFTAGDRGSVLGLASIPEALLGGTVTDPALPASFTFTYLLLPAVLIGACLYLVSRPPDQEVAVHTIGMLLVPLAALVSLATRYQLIEYFEDLPRMFVTVLVMTAMAAPDRLRRWFGIEPIMVVAFGVLPLAADWASAIEIRGRNGSGSVLVIAVVLLACASTRVAPRAKTWLCAVLALGAAAHFVADRRRAEIPYGQRSEVDGPRRHNRARSAHPLLAGCGLRMAKVEVLDWLHTTVPAGSSCFIYGDLPALYTMLQCENPTRLDSVASTFASPREAATASRALVARPPDFLVVQAYEPPIERDEVLQPLLERYELVGTAMDLVGTEAAAVPSCDGLLTIRLYRRR